MRRPLNVVLKAATGIIPLFFASCSGSSSGLGLNAGATAGTSTGTRSVAGSSGGPEAGGITGAFSSAGGATGGAVASASGGTANGGTGGHAMAGGTLPSTAGSPVGGSDAGSDTGGSSSIGSTSALGGSAVAGSSRVSTGGATTTSGAGGFTNLGGSAGGTSAIAGATAVGGRRSGPSFPARFVGNIDTRGAILSDFSKYWDQFTPENAGKWPSVQGASRTTFNWSALDTMYKYTQEHNIVFKEHCFVWGSAQAAWLNNDNVMEAAKVWMKTFCDRYPQTRLIDVVNEPPPHTTPSYSIGLGGGTNTTWDWIANAFKFAREACPDAILILNDYNNCEYSDSAQHIIEIVTAIKKLDAPIDALGCQGHDASKVSVSKFKTNLDKMASDTGLPIYITEYDIGLADDEQQRAQYADHFTMFWDDPNVKGVTVWGYITGATWRSNTGIMSSTGTMRPAMSWLMDFLAR